MVTNLTEKIDRIDKKGCRVYYCDKSTGEVFPGRQLSKEQKTLPDIQEIKVYVKNNQSNGNIYRRKVKGIADFYQVNNGNKLITRYEFKFMSISEYAKLEGLKKKREWKAVVKLTKTKTIFLVYWKSKNDRDMVSCDHVHNSLTGATKCMKAIRCDSRFAFDVEPYPASILI
jgi:hypothetical protein